MNCPRCNGPANEETLREFGGVCPKCLLNFSEEQDAPAFPNLEIVEMIGQGGMGVVYKARQKNLDRIVALKVLSPHLSEDPEFVERFTREARALAQLSHPNIVAIHDSGIHDRVPYLVMEFVDGAPLRSALASGKLTPDRALEVIPQICDALQYAHSHGVVHRDIKPENILIDRQGRVKIADFGLAKLSADQSKITMSGYVLGTPRYMAPEQFEPSGRVDHRADIYSLGVVFYEMLTGEVPMGKFKPPSAKADVDRRLDPVVLKSLEREPEDRYQSASEVKEEVSNFHTRPVPQSLLAVRRTYKFSGVTGCLIIIVGGAVLLAIIAIAMIPHSARSTARSVAPPAPVVTPVPQREERREANPRYQRNAVPEFKVDDVWLAAADLPAGLEGSKFLEGSEVLRKADLPEAVLPDLDSVRGLVFQYGKAVMVGLQFKTEFARRRWQREEVWKKEMEYWHSTLTGDGQALLMLRHDRSAAGAAAAEILQALVEKKYVAKYPQTKK